MRSAALHVWKTLVVNTPRTLSEILPVLVSKLLASLSSPSTDARAGASRCLGELVKKIAERVLPTAVPVLVAGLSSPEALTRCGACLGLTELLQAASRSSLAPFYGRLIPAVQTALCDDTPAVRAAAGEAFSQLFRGGSGADASTEIVPALLASLEGDDPAALEGLRQVLKAQPKLYGAVFPQLAQPPLSAFNAHALGALAKGAGSALPPHLSLIIPPLLDGCASATPDVAAACRSATEAVLLAVEPDAAYQLLGELLHGLQDPCAKVREAAASVTGVYGAAVAQADAQLLPQLLAALVEVLADAEAGPVATAWEAVGLVLSGVPKDELGHHARTLREAVASARERVRRRAPASLPVLVPGLGLPKALAPFVPVYLAAVLVGGPDARAQAAEGLAELVAAASPEGLGGPLVATICGPLIRIVSDKTTAPLKAAILACLTAVVLKAGPSLKPFMPQLQTTFVRGLQDRDSRVVRYNAAEGLENLFRLQTRVDPLVLDIIATLSAWPDANVREALCVALAGVLRGAGSHATQPVLSSLVNALVGELGSASPGLEGRAACATALGAAAPLLSETAYAGLVLSLLNASASKAAAEMRVGRFDALRAVLESSASGTRALPADSLRAVLSEALVDENSTVREAAVRVCGAYLALNANPSFHQLLATAMQDEMGEVRRCALVVVTRLHVSLAPSLMLLLPHAVAALSDPVGPVKLAAELAVRQSLKLTPDDASVTAAASVATAAGLRKFLNDAVLRRLGRLDVDNE